MLAGKRILITGATSGIGRAVALECARQGGSVIVTGRSEEKLREVGKAMESFSTIDREICVDLTSEDALSILLDDCGELDGVVLCAGQVSTAPVRFTTIDKVDILMRVNLKPNISLIQQLLKRKMLKRNSSVVAISSVLGVTAYMPGNAAYGVSKAALEAWMRYCALEYAKRGIRFNTIQPGGIDTPMANLSNLSEEQLESDRRQVPMGRYGTPQEVADAAIFLLSDKASYITGSSLIVDGGRHLKY